MNNTIFETILAVMIFPFWALSVWLNIRDFRKEKLLRKLKEEMGRGPDKGCAPAYKDPLRPPFKITRPGDEANFERIKARVFLTISTFPFLNTPKEVFDKLLPKYGSHLLSKELVAKAIRELLRSGEICVDSDTNCYTVTIDFS
ncbi:hypothetical protein H6775_03515 [Candidatus Nomurabacteria bacterium]|nr:hypothetical protein [Candidatus Nomurabacteria bacterium]